jgi:hypothetical protein
MWPFKQPSHTFWNLQWLEHNLLAGGGLAMRHLKKLRSKKLFIKEER